jgi:hypothetical protein
VSKAKTERKPSRIEETVQVFAAITLPDAQGDWEPLTCGEFTHEWKGLGGDDLECRQYELTGSRTVRIHDAGDGPALATVKFVGPQRCFHMRHTTGGAK